MSGVLSLEVREQMLCSGLCNSAATSIVYLFTSFLGSDVNVETRCIVHRVNIHILICTLNVRETSDDWQTGIFNISCTSRGFCRGCPWDLENCIVTIIPSLCLCTFAIFKHFHCNYVCGPLFATEVIHGIMVPSLFGMSNSGVVFSNSKWKSRCLWELEGLRTEWHMEPSATGAN